MTSEHVVYCLPLLSRLRLAAWMAWRAAWRAGRRCWQITAEERYQPGDRIIVHLKFIVDLGSKACRGL
ncbi:MAG TPA: hypothetical protein VFG73_02530 [Rhodanobacteraceae bacterium]|nr:hypothetical protein [Rhodanobacteraceae bacterium]